MYHDRGIAGLAVRLVLIGITNKVAASGTACMHMHICVHTHTKQPLANRLKDLATIGNTNSVQSILFFFFFCDLLCNQSQRGYHEPIQGVVLR